MKKRAEGTKRLRRPVEEVDEQGARAAARRLVEEMAEEERRFKNGVYEMGREVMRLRARVKELEFIVGKAGKRPEQAEGWPVVGLPGAFA